MEILRSIDTSLFLFVNTLPHTVYGDMAALLLSGVGTFGLIWLFLGSVLIYMEEEKDRLFFLPLLSGITFSYVLTEFLGKPFFGRIRPQYLPGSHLVIFNPLETYSFPSGHATIAFAMAVILSAKEPRSRTVLFVLAALISLSRVYLGVHYPGDILAGAGLGLGIGLGVNALYFRLRRLNRRVGKTSPGHRS